MNRTDLLNDLIAKLERSKVPDEWRYLGTGSPNADILIIGKETSIHANPQQKSREIDNNFSDWKKILSESLPEVKPWDGNNYSPLYPYKGQLLKIYRKKDNGGTSPTWYNYQKLINQVFNKINNRNIDFHENVFITEVNSTPSLKTANANTSSVTFRKEAVLSARFFQDFPVVIISGLGYFEVNENQNEIEKLFGVNFLRHELPEGKKTQEYYFHGSEDQSKILINTRQLGMFVSNTRIRKMGEEIKQFSRIN